MPKLNKTNNGLMITPIGRVFGRDLDVAQEPQVASPGYPRVSPSMGALFSKTAPVTRPLSTFPIYTYAYIMKASCIMALATAATASAFVPSMPAMARSR